jgi:kumamolisin
LLALTVAGCGAPVAENAPPSTTTIAQALGPQQPQRVLHSKVIGRVPADEQIDLVLGMRLTDRGALDRLIARQADRKSADFRHWLTPSQFADQFAPNATDYEALAATLSHAGFEVTRLVDGRSTMSVRGTAANIEQLFSTELDIYQDTRGGKSPLFRAPSASFIMPKALALVDSVVGLDTAYPWRPHHKAGMGTGYQSPDGAPGPQIPSQLRTRYGLDSVTQKGEGETLVILGAGDGPTPADVAGFISTYSLSTVPAAQYAQILVGGPTREEQDEAENEYQEDVLDIDMAMTMAPAASYIHVIVAQNAGGLFGDGISYVVNQIPQAHQVTVSFGSCERLAVFSLGQTEALLQQAVAEGQTWFFSAGDDGTDTCKDVDPTQPPSSFVLTVDYPASSAYAIGVGGTQLTNASTEVAWSDEVGAGGGGLSELFPTPSWQVGVGPYPTQNARRVPDVSALAGTPGVNIYIGGFGVGSVEGTSAAAPMWGGIWALIDQAGGNVGISDYHNKLYQLNGTGFTDITAGNNSPGGGAMGYDAIVGYDLATGWGTPNVPALIGGL